MKFEKTNACKYRANCHSCRTDSSWRQSLMVVGWIKVRDFECPFGVTSATAPAEVANALADLGAYQALNQSGKNLRQGSVSCCGKKQEE